MRLLSPSHIWIDSLFATSAMGKCSLLVSVSLRLRRLSVVQRCTLIAVTNARWTTNNQKLLVLEPKVVVFEPLNKEYWKSKAASNSPVYSSRGIPAYAELQIVVTEVGQVKQTVAAEKFGALYVGHWSGSLSETVNTSRLIVTAPTEDAAPRQPLAGTQRQESVSTEPRRGNRQINEQASTGTPHFIQQVSAKKTTRSLRSLKKQLRLMSRVKIQWWAGEK